MHSVIFYAERKVRLTLIRRTIASSTCIDQCTVNVLRDFESLIGSLSMQAVNLLYCPPMHIGTSLLRRSGGEFRVLFVMAPVAASDRHNFLVFLERGAARILIYYSLFGNS